MPRKIKITDEMAERILSSKSQIAKEKAYASVEKELGIYFKLGKYYDVATNEKVIVIPYSKEREQLNLFTA